MEEFIVCEVQDAVISPITYQIVGDDPTPAEMQAKGKFHEIMFAAYNSQVAFHGAMIIRMTDGNGKPEAFILAQEYVKREVSA